MREVVGFIIGEVRMEPGFFSKEYLKEAARLLEEAEGPYALLRCPHEFGEPYRLITFGEDGATVAHMKPCVHCGISVAPATSVWDWLDRAQPGT